MTHPIFELDQFKDLPLWAQVLMASRLVRRVLARIPSTNEQRAIQVLTAGCDALDACAAQGQVPSDLNEPIRIANSFQPTGTMHSPTVALACAIDAAKAAEASLDFSAAETACSNSIAKSFAWASEAPGMTPLQARILLAADLDLLRFNCKEFNVGRYDAIPKGVFERLIPAN